jgi:hypothetical protein
MWGFNNIEELMKEATIQSKLKDELGRLIIEGKEAKDLDKVLLVYKELQYYLDISKTERYLKEEGIVKLVVSSKILLKELKDKIKKLIDRRDYDTSFINKLRDSGLRNEDIAYITNTSISEIPKLLSGKKEKIRPKSEHRQEFNWIDELKIDEKERDDLLRFLAGFWEQDRMKRFNMEDNQMYAEKQLFVDNQSNKNFINALKNMPNEDRKKYLAKYLITKYNNYKGVLQRKQNISLEESKKMKEDRESGKAKSYAPVSEMSNEKNLFNPSKSFEDEIIEDEEDTYEEDMRRLDERKKHSFNYSSIDDLIG